MSRQDLFVIWERQRLCWWAPACRGYTSNLLEAGAYTAADLKRANLDAGIDEVQSLWNATEGFLGVPHDGLSVLDVLVAERLGNAKKGGGA